MKTILHDEVDEQEFIERYTKPGFIITTIIMAICSQSFFPIFLYIFVLIVIKFAFSLLKFKNNQIEKNDIKAESLRTICIEAKIIKIIVESDAESDYLKIVCEYKDKNGRKRIFRSPKIIGKTRYKEGDQVEIMVEPENFNNYYIKVYDILI